MADEQQEAVLRNSLDAVDRGRRWAILGVGALFVATVLALGALIWTAAANQGPSPRDVGVFNVFFVAAIVQMLLIACSTAILMFHATRMTRAILRRIELIRRD
jgi:hypothetical protein